MRFCSVNLKAFGHFTEHLIEFAKHPNFHIIYGPNEAGKSTTLRGLISALYGIPPRTNDSYLHGNKKLRVEVTLEQEGEILSVARRKGIKNTLLDPQENKSLPDNILERFLGNLNKDMFTTLYGLDHKQLREGGRSLLQGGGDVGASIFAATTGISKLHDVVKELDAESKNLFVRNKNGRAYINQSISDFKTVKQKSAEHALKGRDWRKLEKDYFELKEQRDRIIAEITELDKKKAQAQRIKRCLPLLIQLDDLNNAISNLGEVANLEDDFTNTRVEAEQKLQAASRDKEKCAKRINYFKKEAAKINVRKELLKRSDEIHALVEKLAVYQTKLQETPHLQASIRQAEQEMYKLLQEINPQNTSLDDIEHYRVSYIVKSALKQLATEKTTIDNQLQTKKNVFVELNEELEELNEKLAKLDMVPDLTSLWQTLKSVRQIGNIEQDIDDKHISHDKLLIEIKTKIKQLDFWQGPYRDLVELPVPSLETVKSFQDERQQLISNLNHIGDLIEQLEQEIDQVKTKIATMESQKLVPTDEDLQKVREEREQGWQLIKQAWLEEQRYTETELEFTQGKPLNIAYELTVLKADNLADEMRYDAEKIGKKNVLLVSLNNHKEKKEKLLAKQKSLQEKLNVFDSYWDDLWKQSAIKPALPKEMISWLEARNEILVLVNRLTEIEVEIEKLEETKEKNLNSLLNTLQQLQQTPVNLHSLSTTLSQAEDIYTVLDNKTREKHQMQTAKEELVHKINRQSVRVTEAEDALVSWANRWEENIKKTPLSGDIAVNVVVSYLDKIDELFGWFDEKQKAEDALTENNKFAADYEQKVKGLVDECKLNLMNVPCDIAVQGLNKELQKAEQELTKRNQLEQQISIEQKDLFKAEEEYEDAVNILGQLKSKVNVTKLEELKEVEYKFTQYTALKDELAKLRKQLLLEGEGLSIEELQNEAQGVDPDTILEKIGKIDERLSELSASRNEKLTVFGEIQAKYNEKVSGNNLESLEAEEQAQTHLACLKEQVDDYINLQITRSLLTKAIEKYRDENQGPIIRRGSEVFAKLTLGSFVELKTDFDTKDNPILVGMRNDGQEVEVEGMSDGTLDQLYLALRIAAVEAQLSTNDADAIPLIFDDLLINFDDYRSQATLEVLAELSTKTQVIFFTHHYSLVELAQTIAASKASIHYLTPISLKNVQN